MLTWCLLLLFLDLNPQRTHGSDLKINNLLIKYLTAIYSFNSWESDALRTALGTRNAHDSTRWAAATKRVHSSFPSCKAENRRISLQSSIKHKMGRRKVMFKCIYGNHYHMLLSICVEVILCHYFTYWMYLFSGYLVLLPSLLWPPENKYKI